MICKRPILRVERGDCLGHLATDHAPDDAGTAPLGRATLCLAEVLAMAGTMTFQALILFIAERAPARRGRLDQWCRLRRLHGGVPLLVTSPTASTRGAW